MLRYAHVGLPKTGTTFLQNTFFPEHPEIHNIGKHRRPVDLPYHVRRLLFSDLVDKPEYIFDAAQIANQLDQEQRAVALSGTKRAFGLSSELLTNLVQGRLSLTERAIRLADVLGRDTRIIFFVREQRSWIKSLYATYVREGGLCISFEDFCFHLCFEDDVSAKANLFYDRIHRTYSEIFNPDNVLVLPYESMQADSQLVLNTMCNFLDVSEFMVNTAKRYHQRPSAQALGAMLALNRYWKFGLGGRRFTRFGGFRIPEAYDAYDVAPPAHQDQDKQKHQFMYSPEQNIIDRAHELNLDMPPLRLDIPDKSLEHLLSALAPHNQALELQTDLPLASYGYIT